MTMSHLDMTESLIGLFIVLSLVEHIQLFMRQVRSAWSCRLHIVSMVETEICFHWQEIHGRNRGMFSLARGCRLEFLDGLKVIEVVGCVRNGRNREIFHWQEVVVWSF
uniref:Uncharacterized protein n=1 Tax=Cacopsylla melanoneura TaxID=428564 RepID=A0A8D9AP50_9HEMI